MKAAGPPSSAALAAAVWGLLLFAAAPAALSPQGGTAGSPQKRILELQRTRIDLTTELEELKRVERLFDQGLVSAADVERAQAKADKARLAYQEAMLELVVIPPRLSVERAVKREGPGGERFVTLTLVNLTSGPPPEELGLEEDSQITELVELSRRPIRDIFVSLRDTGADSPGNPSPLRGATVALPYERYIPELAHGQSRSLEFQLLRDVGSVLVHVDFAGQTQETDIHLEIAADGQPVTLVSNPISQEIDLGATGSFALRLSRSSIDERSFGLQVVNLPPQVTATLADPESRARLSQIYFPAGVQERNLELRVTLPERTDEQVRVDQPLELWVVAYKPDAGEPFPRGTLPAGGDAGGDIAETLRTGGVGHLRLEILPRGVGRLEILSTSLFSEIAGDEPLTVALRLRNDGTRTLHNVRPLGEAPLNWKLAWRPDVVAALEPQQEAEVEMALEAPEEAPVGDYEVKLEAESLAQDRVITAPTKIYRVRIQPGSSLMATVLLISLLLALTAGIVVFGIRVTRR